MWELQTNFIGHGVRYAGSVEAPGCPPVISDSKISEANRPRCDVIVPPGPHEDEKAWIPMRSSVARRCGTIRPPRRLRRLPPRCVPEQGIAWLERRGRTAGCAARPDNARGRVQSISTGFLEAVWNPPRRLRHWTLQAPRRSTIRTHRCRSSYAASAPPRSTAATSCSIAVRDSFTCPMALT